MTDTVRQGRAHPRPVFVLMGPTASGKTDLILDLFSGEDGGPRPGLPAAEIISADSMQAYRGMDVGTAKPSAAELARLPHHLLDIRDPGEAWSAGDFVRLADSACAEIRARGRLPVVAGGTGFYIRNFVFGLPGAPEADAATREAVAAEIDRRGLAAVWAELVAFDPEAAGRMHPNNRPRIQRALEILRQTGRRPSEFAPADRPRACHDFLLVELTRPRDELYARIDARVELMFERGLEAELRRLLARGYGASAPGLKAIGYSEFLDPAVVPPAELAAPRLSPGALDSVKAAVKLDTRRYAKRQETFFRGLPLDAAMALSGADWLEAGRARLAALLRDFLGD